MAVGVQADLVYDERTDFDESWDGIWHSAGRITERGFEALAETAGAVVIFGGAACCLAG